VFFARYYAAYTDRNVYSDFIAECEGKKPQRISRYGYEDNIKIDIKEAVLGGGRGLNSSSSGQGSAWTFVNTVMNICVTYKAENS
jgi:hypothetical protein